METLVFILIIILAFQAFAAWVMFVRCYQKVPPGEAFIRSGFGDVKVTFTGIVVLPTVQQIERLDLTVRKIEIHCTGASAMTCNDGLCVEFVARFFLRIDKTEADVLRVVNEIGIARARDVGSLQELFQARFTDALRSTAGEFTYADLEHYRERFGQAVRQRFGDKLGGFTLHDVVVSEVRKAS